MKAQAFLNLVSEMMTAQQDYFKAKRARKLDTHNLLVAARSLEGKVMKVIDEGKLEPDPVPKLLQASMFGSQCQILLDGTQRCGNTSSRTIIVCGESGEPTLINMCVECWKKL